MKRLFAIAFTAATLAACTHNTTLSGLNPKNFEGEYEGAPTALYALTNKAGMEVCITNFGGLRHGPGQGRKDAGRRPRL